MGEFLFKCPNSGRRFETSVKTDDTNLSVLRSRKLTMRCPVCGDMHEWEIVRSDEQPGGLRGFRGQATTGLKAGRRLSYPPMRSSCRNVRPMSSSPSSNRQRLKSSSGKDQVPPDVRTSRWSRSTVTARVGSASIASHSSSMTAMSRPAIAASMPAISQPTPA